MKELWEGEVRAVDSGGEPVLEARVQGRVVRWLDRCPHLGLSLEGGALVDGVLTCPHHGWSFDLLTGEGRNPTRCRLAPASRR